MKAIVVGAGIAGASAAFHLVEFGAEVSVIDNNATGRATLAGAGIICPWLSHNRDRHYQELSFAAFRYYPGLLARLAAAGQSNIEYDLVGGLAVGESRQQLDPVVRRLENHLTNGVKEVGEVRVLDQGGPKRLFPYLDSRLAGVYLSGAARLSGESVRTALLDAACASGVELLSGEAVLEQSGKTVTGIRIDGELIAADVVVLAAGAWSVNLCRPLRLELALEAQRGQILHLKVPDANTGKYPVIVPVLNDYYLLAFRDSRIVIGATRETGSGFDARVTAGGVAEVLRECLEIAPGLSTATLAEIRVGLRPMSNDGLPLLGRPRGVDRLVIATGMGRYGLTVGPYVGRLAAQIAVGQTPEIDVGAFTPER
ncbi:MAG: FAD-dependent oxidoreductase [Verrucomicrobia bacterium]|nr:FAD-dependent oxidoreductase [Verrucomicrobiota bacterium]